MKNPVQNKFTYLRKSIVSILASNAFKAAICMLILLALFACSSDAPTEKSNEITDTEVNNPSQKPEAPEVPDNSETPDHPETPDNPNTSEELEEPQPNAPEAPEKPDEPQPDEPQPDDPEPITLSEEEREAALKNIFGITETSEEMPDTITLTAQAIKALGDISSGRYVEGIVNSDIKAVSDKTSDGYEGAITKLRDAYGIDVKNIDNKKELNYAITNGIVIRDEADYELDEYRKANSKYYLDENGNIDLSIENYYPFGTDEIYNNKTVPYYQIENNGEPINLTGTFYYDDLHIKATGIKADDATFTIKDNKKHLFSPDAILNLYKDLNGGNVDYAYILKNANKPSNYTFPNMEFYIFDENYDNKSIDILTLIDLYVQNSKADNIKFRNIPYEANSTSFNGNPNGGSMLFEGNIEKDGSVPNVNIDTILKVRDTHYRKLVFKNLKITGDYNETESEDINARFTNVIFEGDVSGIKNSDNEQFNGVVYFKDKPYDIICGSTVNFKGILKLDVLTNDMNYNTFNILGFRGGNSSVIDVRNVKETDFKNYNVLNPILTGGYVNGIYYPNYVIAENVKNFNGKIADGSSGGFIRNAFSDNKRIYTDDESERYRYPTSKTPRTLSEFEYFGNFGHFEKSAKSTYSDVEFKTLHKVEQEQLTADEKDKLIALNNKIKTRAAYI